MKKQLKSLLLIVVLISLTLPAWAQSTEGKEFWVALLYANSPTGYSADSFKPFIAISSKKQCQVTVSNPSQNWSQPQRTVPADSWYIIDDIPVDKWYDATWDASNASESVRQLGIKVKATEDVSVFAAIRMEFSYDATNVLPTSALGSNYIIQDYPTYNSEGHNDDGSPKPDKQAHSVFTILATENNTTVAITPTIATMKNKPAGQRFTIDLQEGETYQVVSSPEVSFSGTSIEAYATNNPAIAKKIAVFSGADFTQVPGGKSARDCLYEQTMPIEYWGTDFVVTRSQEKDANRIRITAQTDGTKIFIDGLEIPTTLGTGDTYEFEISENLASTDMASAITNKKVQREIPPIMQGEAHYIHTSCPCAVFSYDVSSDYILSSGSEVKSYKNCKGDTKHGGDPSMVWISPLQQRISHITFGSCGTQGPNNLTCEGHTNRHFVNIVCLTTDTATVKLSSELRSNIPVKFTPVPGNPTYSYARVFLVDTDGSSVDKVYTLTSKQGVVAHVYGSGLNESYAYSVGSAAVKQGINVNNVTFVDGFISPDLFCIEDLFNFDANIGTDEITRVDWSFGDGTIELNGNAQTTHKYSVPGWYDVHADLYGHQVCTDEDELPLGSVQFAFKVVKQDTVWKPIEHRCIDKDSMLDGRKLSADSIVYYMTYGSTDTPSVACPDTVFITPITYGMETVEVQDTITANDFIVINGKTYTESTDVEEIIEPFTPLECRRYIQYYVKIKSCLHMNITNDLSSQHICPGNDSLQLVYDKSKGEIDGDAIFKVPGYIDTTFTIPNENTTNGRLYLPTVKFTKPGYYSGQIIVKDLHCGGQLTFPVDFAVFYPDSIFCYKYNNVLAVYKPGQGHNPGYEFVSYEWHLIRDNVDTIIASSDIGTSVFYLGQGESFKLNDGVYVVLTDVRGMKLASCTQWLPDPPDYDLQEGEPQQAPARKMIINGKFIIRRDDADYDIYGQRIQ